MTGEFFLEALKKEAEAMVTKSKKTGAAKGKVKVGKLNLEKETLKDLTSSKKRQIKGGLAAKCACYDPLTSRRG